MRVYHHHIRRNVIVRFAFGDEIFVKFFVIKSKSIVYCIFIDTAYYYSRVTPSDVTI